MTVMPPRDVRGGIDRSRADSASLVIQIIGSGEFVRGPVL
jgi:hypothetical protein